MKKIFALLLTIFFQIRSEISLISDLEAEDFLAEMVQKIYKTIGANRKPKVHIIKNDSINAFATFDDHIFVYTGLFTKLDNAMQLFSILSHEVGHIVENHIARKIEYIKNINILLPFLINEYMHFGSSEERVADLFAINILKKNQYSLQDFKKVMQKFFQNEVISYTEDIRKNILNKLDHPSSISRIEIIQSYINKTNYKIKPFDKELEKKFQRIKLKFLGFLKNEDEFKLLTLKTSVSKDDIDYGNVMLQKKLYNFDAALTILNNLIQKYPKNYYFLIEKTEILFQQGNLDAAIKTIKVVLKKKKLLYAQLLLARIILSKNPINTQEIEYLLTALKKSKYNTQDEEYDINRAFIACYTAIKDESMRLFYIAKSLYLEMYENELLQSNSIEKSQYVKKIKSILSEALKNTNNPTIKNRIKSFLTYISNTN